MFTRGGPEEQVFVLSRETLFAHLQCAAPAPSQPHRSGPRRSVTASPSALSLTAAPLSPPQVPARGVHQRERRRAGRRLGPRPLERRLEAPLPAQGVLR